MMRRLFFLLVFCSLTILGFAQSDTLRGHWVCKAENLHLYLNLAEETLVVPRYEFLGAVNGYMVGRISDTWFLTSFKTNNKGGWTMRFSNDSGADTQEVILTLLTDGTLHYKVVGTNYLRRSERRKWVYLPNEMDFEPTTLP